MGKINPNLIKLAELTHNPDLKIDKDILKRSKPKSTGKTNTNFSLENLTGFYRINGVNYREGIYTVDLLKNLLDKGNYKTQDEWVEYSQQAQQNNEFYVGDLPLYFAIKHSLYQNRENPRYKAKIEDVKQFLKQQMFDNCLITLTRIKYSRRGKDKVIHNYGMPDQYEISEDLFGPNELVKDSNNNAAYKALLGTDNTKEINDVYKWLTGVDAYLSTLNYPIYQRSIEHVVGLFTDSARVTLGCDWDIGFLTHSLGVRAAKTRN